MSKFLSCAFTVTVSIGIALAQIHTAIAAGISDFEGTRCVAVALDMGSDPMACADADLPGCQTPDWFPTEPAGPVDQMTSYGLDTSVRYNQVNYGAGSSTSWEHDWYSNIDTPYGPALPSGGHLWNEYSGSALVKSVSCDVHGTFSYP